MSDQRNQIDDLFKDALSGARVTPSKGVWSGIENQWFGSGGTNRLLILLSMFLVATSIGLAFYFKFQYPDGYVLKAEESFPVESSLQSTAIMTSNPTMSSESSPAISPEVLPSNSSTQNSSPTIKQQIPDHSGQISEPAKLNQAFRISDEKNMEQEIHEPATNSSFRKTLFYPNLTSIHSQIPGISFYTKPVGLTTFDIGPFMFKDPSAEVDYIKPENIGMGIHATPGITFYDPNPNKYFVGADVTFNYTPSRWLIQAGMGINWMQDAGKYNINYKTYDSIGYYREVTSFHFATDNPDSIIINYKNTTVFDSIPKVAVSEKNNTYTYFTVPIHVGYRIVQNQKISAYIKAGLIFSLLVDKSEPVVEFQSSDASLISIEKMVPARTKTAWQFTTGIQISYQISRKTTISIEPYYGKYLSPVYENDAGWENKKPSVFGIRSGIDYKF